jgi:hypothetical protein
MMEMDDKKTIKIKIAILIALMVMAFTLSCNAQEKPFCLDKREQKEMLYKLIKENELLQKRGIECDTAIVGMEKLVGKLEKESAIKDTIIHSQVQIIDKKDRIIFDKSGQVDNGEKIIALQEKKISSLSYDNISLQKANRKEVRRKRIWRTTTILATIGLVVAIIL